MYKIKYIIWTFGKAYVQTHVYACTCVCGCSKFELPEAMGVNNITLRVSNSDRKWLKGRYHPSKYTGVGLYISEPMKFIFVYTAFTYININLSISHYYTHTII